jgi:hypothetical protein
MARDSAEIRGRARVRPFRVAQLVDTTSAEEVRDAIANLTVAWGGIYTPIIDVNQPLDDIELQARLFDVDALHVEVEKGELVDDLRRSGWLWGGRGRFGPFAASEEGFSSGVLPARALALDHPPLLLPEWSRADVLDLFYTAVFGTPGPPNADPTDDSDHLWVSAGSARVGIGAMIAFPDVTVDNVGAIQSTRVGISTEVRHALDGMNGLFVVRTDNVQDVVNFWNLRTFGRPIIALPAKAPADLLAFLTRGTLPGGETRSGGQNARVEKHLGVWGLEDASKATRSAIDAMAERLQMTVLDHPGRSEQHFMFPGLDSRFESSIRAEFPPNARSVMVRVPSVPLVPGLHQVMPGTVAVEIDVHAVPGLDPRSTASLPPLRRFGTLLGRSGMSDADHVRITSEGDGIVLGVSATNDEVPIGFAYNLDAIQTFFDDKDLRVSQSDDGAFQTRAAEMLGGPFGGVMVQPGVRALIDKAGRSNAGLTLQQLRAEVKKHRGAWPDKLSSLRTTEDDYVERAVNNLLFTGLFVPMLDVHCSNCRVETQVSPRDLDTSIQCEFCGESFRLALSLALSRSKSRWRYRLASHLGTEKVKALLPALATMSLLGQMTTRFGAAGTQAFGVEFRFAGNKRVEADIVAYLARPDWAVALGEVKNSNWIDANDVENLEELQRRLDEKRVRSVLTFATLKDQLAPEEVVALRGLVERGTEITTAFGGVTPRVPLVLTAKELSLPWDHDDHPKRWTQPGSGGGIFATAIESCKRNLGLVDLRSGPGDGRPFNCNWQDPFNNGATPADDAGEAIA